jgi:hypothetical protein
MFHASRQEIEQAISAEHSTPLDYEQKEIITGSFKN